MDTIDRGLNKFFKSKRPTSQRAHLIQTVCDTLFEGKDFKKVLGQTRHFTVSEIRDIFERAKAWNVNPRALFWKLIREKQDEIKKQIQTAEREKG